MRSRVFVAVAVALVSVVFVSRANAQESTDRFADGLIPGDYLRVGFASVSPVNPQGSIRDWNRGQGVGLAWENWAPGGNGVSKFGFGLEAAYSLFPLNEQRFIGDFVNGPNGPLSAATGKKAAILQIGVTTKFRIPTPFIMPVIGVGFGFLDWKPGEIQYTAVGGNATAKQQHRSGGAISFSGGFDKHIIDRYAVFADATYTYAYTSFGEGLGASGSSCVTSNCDLLKNTQLGVIRGGLRVRVGR